MEARLGHHLQGVTVDAVSPRLGVAREIAGPAEAVSRPSKQTSHRPRWDWRVCAVGSSFAALALAMSACAPLPPAAGQHQGAFEASATSPAVATVDLKALPDTIGLEHEDRVDRFVRLARMIGTTPPRVDQLQVGAGQVRGVNYAIPVVRVIFEERVFFDFDRDALRPEAEPVLDLMAENMRRDVPDAQLLVVGHTDAKGTDPYNDDLSLRRATAVLKALAARGAQVGNIAVVPMGKRQPVAPNWSDEGRALNRRVEFMISARQEANTLLLEKRRIFAPWLKTDRNDPQPGAVDTHFTTYMPRPDTAAMAAADAAATAEKRAREAAAAAQAQAEAARRQASNAAPTDSENAAARERQANDAAAQANAYEAIAKEKAKAMARAEAESVSPVPSQSYSTRPAEPTSPYEIVPRDIYQAVPVSQEFGL